MSAILLSAEQLNELASIVASIVRRSESEVLTRAEAAALAGFRDPSAFHRWAKRNRLKPANRGRYSRSQVALAIERESRRRAA